MSAVISRCECFVISNRPRRMIHEHGTAPARSNSILGTDVVAQSGDEVETATLTDGVKLRRVAGCVTYFNGVEFIVFAIYISSNLDSPSITRRVARIIHWWPQKQAARVHFSKKKLTTFFIALKT